MPSAPQHVQSLSLAAGEKSPTERATFLQRHYGADAKLRQRVVGLLRADDQACYPELLSSAQQYLQALREGHSPPPELCEAWEKFYRACDPLVRRAVAACRLYRVDADDCVQEAWVELASKLTRFEYNPLRGSFEAWLHVVVRRAACRYARRDNRQTAGRIDHDLAAIKCPRSLGPATTLQREELRMLVRQSLIAFRTSVSSRAFRILVMTAVHGQTATKAGKLLRLSPGRVRVTRHRTTKKFRQFVAGRPGLREALGVLDPTKTSMENRGNKPPGERLTELSANLRDSL